MVDSLYHKALMAHARAGHGRGRLAHPDGSATIDNPLCGDRVTIDVKLTEGRISALGHRVRGCLLCEAAASVIGTHAAGLDAAAIARARAAVDALLGRAGAEAPDDAWPELAAFAPVRAFKSRHECVRLSFEALAGAVRDASS